MTADQDAVVKGAQRRDKRFCLFALYVNYHLSGFQNLIFCQSLYNSS